MDIREILGRELLFLDGAMGTMLQRNGLQGGDNPEVWNLTHPEILNNIHTAYLEAGSNIITANTFGCNRYKLEETGHTVDEISSAAISIVKKSISDFEAINDNNRGRHYVALDVGPLGKLLQPIGPLSFDEAVEAFAEQIVAGTKAGADIILCETFTDNYELKAAILAAKENSNLPIFVSIAPDENGRLLTGGDIASVTAMCEGLGVDAIGMNCGFGPKQFLKFLPELVSVCETPVFVQPNAGLPKVENGKTIFDVLPEEFAEDVMELIKGGCCLVGGCCGTSPDYIRAEVEYSLRTFGEAATPAAHSAAASTEAVSGRTVYHAPKAENGAIRVTPLSKKNLTVISSYTHAVYFGDKPLLIGERINPTGKKALKQALRDKNISYIINEAIAEEDAGVDILDVNVGLPEIDECEMMEIAIKEITGVSDLPLQIDTSDIKTMERALRIYNGKPLLNSVNGKEESMEAVLPLAKKYGAAVVCLTLDENGIPETIEERVAIAQKIIDRAAEYGIDKKNLLFDSLTMTVSTDITNGKTTLGAMKQIRDTFGVNTVLGVSNVSFGLPLRSLITTTFFTLAMENGLSAGIINPLDERLMAAYDCYLTVKGYDRQCLGYIEKYTEKTDPYTVVKNGQIVGGSASATGSNTNTTSVESASQTNESPLFNAVVRGLQEKSAIECRSMLRDNDPITIIDGHLIPALDKVGKAFEQKKLFLPQLLMSADSAKAAFDEIKKYYAETGKQGQPKGTVVVATVKGDVHDIGKNIVKVLLENYDYNVLDLGKDVAPETIVETVLEHNIKLVGLSALMTTTVVSMEETIRQLRERAPFCKVVVGGAVLTKEYAEKIGADAYSPEAMATIRYANEVFGVL